MNRYMYLQLVAIRGITVGQINALLVVNTRSDVSAIKVPLLIFFIVAVPNLTCI
jgi:hypothetical protein